MSTQLGELGIDIHEGFDAAQLDPEPDCVVVGNVMSRGVEVVEAMLPFFTEQFGNPSSLHRFGDKVGRAIKQARKQVQALLGAEHDSEIIFTSCGTESDSTAILSALKAQPDRKEIITTVVEHPAVLSLCQYLEKDAITRSLPTISTRCRRYRGWNTIVS